MLLFLFSRRSQTETTTDEEYFLTYFIIKEKVYPYDESVCVSPICSPVRETIFLPQNLIKLEGKRKALRFGDFISPKIIALLGLSVELIELICRTEKEMPLNGSQI